MSLNNTPAVLAGSIDLSKESEFFQQLGIVQDRIAYVRTLTYDVIRLEADRGRNALELGRKLKMIRDALTTGEGTSNSAWTKWCETFTYTQDYANRMIHMAECFSDDLPGLERLSLQHLREIARFSDNQSDRVKLAKIAEEHRIGSKQLRYLVSETKKGNLNLDELIAQNPNVQAELDRRIKAAKEAAEAQAAERIEKLKRDLEEADAQNRELCNDLNKKNEQIDKLAKDIKMREASIKIGEGDPELGKLRIELEQRTQERDNLILKLDEIQKDMRRIQYEHDRWINSPTGQAKVDLSKTMADIQKFFKDTMTPAYLSLRLQGVATPEATAEVLKVVGAIEEWAAQVRATLGSVNSQAAEQ